MGARGPLRPLPDRRAPRGRLRPAALGTGAVAAAVSGDEASRTFEGARFVASFIETFFGGHDVEWIIGFSPGDAFKSTCDIVFAVWSGFAGRFLR